MLLLVYLCEQICGTNRVYYIAAVHDYEHTTAKHRQGSTHDFIRAAKGLLLHEQHLIDQLYAQYVKLI